MTGVGGGPVNRKPASWRAQAGVPHRCESWQGDFSLDVFNGTREKSPGKQAVWSTFLLSPMTEQKSQLFRLGLFVLCCSVLLLHLKSAFLLLFITIFLTYDLNLEILVCLTLVTFPLGNVVMSPELGATFCQPWPLTLEFSEQIPPSSWVAGPWPLTLGLPRQELCRKRHREMLLLTPPLGFSLLNLRQKTNKHLFIFYLNSRLEFFFIFFLLNSKNNWLELCYGYLRHCAYIYIC